MEILSVSVEDLVREERVRSPERTKNIENHGDGGGGGGGGGGSHLNADAIDDGGDDVREIAGTRSLLVYWVTT